MPSEASVVVPFETLKQAAEAAWKQPAELLASAVKALRALEAYEEHAVFCENGCKGRIFVEDGCLEGLRLKTETNRLRFQAKKLASGLGL